MASDKYAAALDAAILSAIGAGPQTFAALLASSVGEARLQGRLEAFAMAMTECDKPTRHGGGRDCREIRTAIDILHLDTLRQMQAANAPSPGMPRLNDDPDKE